MKTSDLNNGERLVVERRRAEQSQPQAAADWGVSLYKYRRWEKNEDQPPRASLCTLRPYEACFIHRRRAGISLQDLAQKLGISRWWLCQIEYGRAEGPRLIAHWASADKPWRPKLNGPLSA